MKSVKIKYFLKIKLKKVFASALLFEKIWDMAVSVGSFQMFKITSEDCGCSI